VLFGFADFLGFFYFEAPFDTCVVFEIYWAVGIFGDYRIKNGRFSSDLWIQCIEGVSCSTGKNSPVISSIS
jgi:hypothetical protein